MSPVTLASKLGPLVGTRSANALAKAYDLATVDDLLRHYPRRYAERGRLSDLSGLREDEHVTVMARVVSAKDYSFRPRGGGRPGGRNVRTEVIVTDDTGRLLLTFFRQPWLRKRLLPGTLGLFAGKVNVYRNRRQLLHPEMHLLDDADDGAAEGQRFSDAPIPLYRASSTISSWTIAKCVALVLDALEPVSDPVPEEVLKRRGLCGAGEALEWVHRPRTTEDHRAARARLKFEEAFVLQTVLAERRRAVCDAPATARGPVAGALRDRFLASLPFELTGGQHEVDAQVCADLAAPHPMHRLLQGEVGSGKTVVALLAMLQVVDAGGQAALLAPTEVLAQQHHRSITAMLGDLAAGGMLGGAADATRVGLLTGSLGAKAKQESLLDAASGAAGIVVGTHALLQEKVQFADLGLVVVDEQHRFGVEQRAALAEKAHTQPHVLVMTATPIPRTVAMTSFGDLDTSTLSELPRGRQPIQSTVVPAAQRPAWMERVWERVREEVGRGRQAYVVCPRIGDGAGEDEPSMHGVLELHEELVAGPLAGLRVGLLHGRMSPEDKESTMAGLAEGSVDVLVATTVIEVGVDVPNATVMVVMDADRFGVSQLHQLRGRVGRGSEAGLCLLVTDSDAPTARERLEAVAGTSDGFRLSRLDVELRREGDVLGARQSGVRSSLKLLSVVHDEDVIVQAREDAAAIVDADPALVGYPPLREAVDALERSTQSDYLERS